MTQRYSRDLTETVPGWLLEQVRTVPHVAEDHGAEEAFVMIDSLRQHVHLAAACRQLTSNQTVQLLVRLASIEARLIAAVSGLQHEPDELLPLLLH